MRIYKTLEKICKDLQDFGRLGRRFTRICENLGDWDRILEELWDFGRLWERIFKD